MLPNAQRFFPKAAGKQASGKAICQDRTLMQDFPSEPSRMPWLPSSERCKQRGIKPVKRIRRGAALGRIPRLLFSFHAMAVSPIYARNLTMAVSQYTQGSLTMAVSQYTQESLHPRTGYAHLQNRMHPTPEILPALEDLRDFPILPSGFLQ